MEPESIRGFFYLFFVCFLFCGGGTGQTKKNSSNLVVDGSRFHTFEERDAAVEPKAGLSDVRGM